MIIQTLFHRCPLESDRNGLAVAKRKKVFEM